MRNKTNGENNAVTGKGIYIYLVTVNFVGDTGPVVLRVSDNEVKFINIRVDYSQSGINVLYINRVTKVAFKMHL